MRHPAVTLHMIVEALQDVYDAGTLNPQQTTFVKLIHDLSQQLLTTFDAMPDSGYAVRRIIPPLAEALAPKLVALYGYARMLLEFPDSFGGDVLNEAQARAMTIVYEEGHNLAKDIDQLALEAFNERVQERKRPTTSCDVLGVLDELLPVCRYWLTDVPVKLIADVPDSIPLVKANRYHLAEIIQHVLLTIARELIEFGTIRVAVHKLPDQVEVGIMGSGLAFDIQQMAILFSQSGRHIYSERLHQDGGSLRIQRDLGQGATLFIQLPLANATI